MYKKLSVFFVMIMCALTVLVGCGDPYKNMSFSLSESSIDLFISNDDTQNDLSTKNVVATIANVGDGVSNKIILSHEGDDCVRYEKSVQGYKTTYTFTAKSLGHAKYTFLTEEGNKSQTLYINVYKKIESVNFANDVLAIPNGGSIDLSNQLVFEPDGTNQTDVTYYFVDKEGNEIDGGYTYMSLSSTGTLKMDRQIDLSQIVDGVVSGTNIPYDISNDYPYPCVYVRVVSNFNNELVSSVKEIYLVDLVSINDVDLQAENLTEQPATIGKDDNGVWTVVLADNSSTLPTVLYNRVLSFVFDQDNDINRKYNVELVNGSKYLDNGTNNPVAFVTPLENDDVAQFRIFTNRQGSDELSFRVTYKDFPNILNFEIKVKVIVKTFPETIMAYSSDTELSLIGDSGEKVELNVLDLLDNEPYYLATPLRITTDSESDNVKNRIYFTVELGFDENVNQEIRGNIFIVDNFGNPVTSTTQIINGSQLYVYHNVTGDLIESIAHDKVWIKVTVHYDLNPSANPSATTDDDYKYMMTYEKSIPVAIYKNIGDYGVTSSLYIDISKQGNNPVTLLSSELGVEVTNFSLITATPGASVSSSIKDGDTTTHIISLYGEKLFSIVFNKLEIYVMANDQGATGEVVLQIHDSIRDKNINTKVVIYSPLLGVYTDITNEAQYKGYLLKSEYEYETSVNDSYISALHLSINSSSNVSNPENIGLPINIYNLVSTAGGASQRKIVNANDVTVQFYEWNAANEAYIQSHTYLAWSNGKLYTYDRSYTNTEHPLKVTITVQGYTLSEDGKTVIMTKKQRDFFVNIYEVIHDFAVTMTNGTIYEKSSLGMFDYDYSLTDFRFTYDARYYDETSIAKRYEILNKDYVVWSVDIPNSDETTGYETVNVTIGDLVVLFDYDQDGNISLIADWQEVASIVYGENLIHPIIRIQSATAWSYEYILERIYTSPILIQLGVSIQQYSDTDLCETLSKTYTITLDYAQKIDNIVTNTDANGIYIELKQGQNLSQQITFETFPVDAFNNNLIVYSYPTFVEIAGVDNSNILTNNLLTVTGLKAGEGYIVVASADSYDANGMPTLLKKIKVVVADGTKAYPFQIKTAQQFLNIKNDYKSTTIDGVSTLVNTYYYVLTGNIVLTRTYNDSLFAGVFAGGLKGLYEYELFDEYYQEQYTISGYNLTINELNTTEQTKSYGLFEILSGTLDSVVIKNSTIDISEASSSTLETLYVGMLAGQIKTTGGYNDGAIIASNGLTMVQGTIIVDRSQNENAISYIGAYVGAIDNAYINITNANTSSTNVDVAIRYTAHENSTSAIGGVAGYVNGGYAPQTFDYSSTIYGVNIGGSIVANTGNVGGVVGYVQNAQISYNTSQMVISGGNNIGGIVGYSNNTTVDYNKVEFVSTQTDLQNAKVIGGIVGYAENATNVRYSYARRYNNVDTNIASEISNSIMGGIVGVADNTSIIGSYFDGNIKNNSTLSNQIGSIIGADKDGGVLSTIENSFAYGDIDSDNKFVSNREINDSTALNQALNYGTSPTEGGFAAVLNEQTETVTNQTIYISGHKIENATGQRGTYTGISKVSFGIMEYNGQTYNVGIIVVDGEERYPIVQLTNGDQLMDAYIMAGNYTICDIEGNRLIDVTTSYEELKNMENLYVSSQYEYSNFSVNVSSKIIEGISSSYIANNVTGQTAVVQSSSDSGYNLNDTLNIDDISKLSLDTTNNSSVYQQMMFNIYSVNGDSQSQFTTSELWNNGEYYDWLHFVTSGGTTINHNLPIMAYPINEKGFGVTDSSLATDMKILYNLVPTEISVTIADTNWAVNNPYVKVDNDTKNKLVLTYNEKKGLYQYSSNNTYKIGLVTDENNNIVSYAVATQENMAAFDIDTRVKLYSTNSSVVEIIESQDGFNLKTNGTGRCTLTITAMMNPNVSVSVDILVINSLRELVMYNGNYQSSTEFTEYVGDTNVYSFETKNYYNFDGQITYDYIANENVGYIVEIMSVSPNTQMSFANQTIGDTSVDTYFAVNDLEGVKVAALAVGENASQIKLKIIPYLKLDNENIDFVYNQNYPNVQGIVIEDIAKEYTFNIQNKARDLTLEKSDVSITPNTPATFSVSFITSAVKDGQLFNDGLVVKFDNNEYNVNVLETYITANNYLYLQMTDNYTITPIVDNDKEYLVTYNFVVYFNSEIYRNSQDYIRGGEYIFEFSTQSNAQLVKDFVVTLNLLDVENIYTHFYPSGQYDTTQTGAFNPSEVESNYIVPGKNGLLKINVTPELSNVDYLIITADDIMSPYVLFTQYYAVQDADGIISSYEYYADGPETGNQLMVRRVSALTNSGYRYDGNYYINMLLSSNAPVNTPLHLNVTAIVDNQAVSTMTFTLDVKPMPAITITIDDTHESVLAAGQRKEIKVETVETDYINYDIYEYYTVNDQSIRRSYTDINSTLFGNVEIVEENGVYYLVSTSALYGQEYYVEFTASKLYNGVREYAVDTIKMQTVQYEIKDLFVSGVTNGQASMKNGTIFTLNVELGIDYNEILADKVSSSVKTLQNIFNGINDYYISVGSNAIDVVTYQNTWNYVVSNGPSSTIYPFINATSQFNNSITYYAASMENKTNSYLLARKITGTTNIPRIAAIVQYYYNDLGLPTAYNVADVNVSDKIVYMLQLEFDLTILENSTYDHPNPIYDANGLFDMTNEEAHYILVNDITLENWSPLDAKFKSFDGNGYVIKIKSFDLTSFNLGQEVSLGIFKEIYKGSILKNITIDVSELLVSDLQTASIDLTRYGEVQFGLLSPTNNGTITNAKIINSSKDKIGYYLNIATNESYNHQIGGLVSTNANNGSITNSYIGVVDNINSTGEVVLKNSAINSQTEQGTNIISGENTYADLPIYPFVIAGSNQVGGIAVNNNGTIASTYINKVGITNTSKISDNNLTAGFVVNNNGTVFESFIQGDGIDNSTTFRANNKYYVESKGNIGAFVHTNTGEISNAYVNINVKTNSGKTAGFVYNNSGEISYCYTTSKSITLENVGSTDVQGSHGPFTGIDDQGRFQANEYQYFGCYYLVVGDEQSNAYEIADPIYTTNRNLLDTNATQTDIINAIKQIDETFNGTQQSEIINEINTLNDLTNDSTLVDVITEMNRKGLTGDLTSIGSNASLSEIITILGQYTAEKVTLDNYIAVINELNNLSENSSTPTLVAEVNYLLGKYNILSSSVVSNPFLYVGSYNGFSISTGVDTNYIWAMSDVGPKLVSCSYNSETYSFRYIDGQTSSADTGYNYTYHQKTSYGSPTNPLLVSSGDEFIRFILDNTNVITINNEKLYVFGAKLSSMTSDFNTVSNVRLVNNIELGDLANTRYSYGSLENVYLREIIFAGVLEGNGMTISNINLKDNISAQTKLSYGLFGQVGLTDKMLENYSGNAVIKNVNLTVNSVESSATLYTGTLAGAVYNANLIDISIKGLSMTTGVQGEKVVGGLAGIVTGNTVLKNIDVGISVSSEYTSTTYVQDPANYEYGYNIYSKQIDKLGRVVTNNIGYVGGIAGIVDVNNLDVTTNDNQTIWDIVASHLQDEDNASTVTNLSSDPTSGTIRDLTVSGSIVLTGENVGGVFGYVGANTRVKNIDFVLESTNQAIMARNISGVIVSQLYGIVEKTSVDVEYERREANDTTLPSVVGITTLFNNGTNSARIMGGLVGYMKDAIILDSYTKANVMNQNSTVAGGIVGKVEGNAFIQRVYSTGFVLSQSVMGGAIGVVKRMQVNDVNSNIYLDYVVAANTWDNGSNSIQTKLSENYKEIYTYTADSSTNTTRLGSFVYRMPEIGNQGMVVPKYSVQVAQTSNQYVYKIRDNETGSTLDDLTIAGSNSTFQIGDTQYTIDSNFNVKLGDQIVTCEIPVSKTSTFYYIGSLIGRYNLTTINDDGTSSIDYNVKLSATENGVVTRMYENTALALQYLNTIYSTTMQSARVSDDTSSYSRYVIPKIAADSLSYTEQQKQIGDYFSFNNYIGWQRQYNTLVAISPDEGALGSGDDRKPLVKANVFFDWQFTSIDTKSTETLSVDWIINNQTNLPEFTDGTETSFKAITNLDDFNTQIIGAESTKNKYYTIAGDIGSPTLSLENVAVWLETFEGIMVGANNPDPDSNGKYTIYVHDAQLFGSLKSANIMNLNFVFVVSNKTSLQMTKITNTQQYARGMFVNTSYNTTISNCTFEVITNEEQLSLNLSTETTDGITNTNAKISDTGVLVGYMSDTHITNAEINIDKDICWTNADAGLAQNMGLFGRLVSSSLSNFSLNTAKDVTMIYNLPYNYEFYYEGSTRIKLVNLGGLVGYLDNSNLSNIKGTMSISAGELNDVVDRYSSETSVGYVAYAKNSNITFVTDETSSNQINIDLSNVTNITTLYAGKIVGHAINSTIKTNNNGNNIVYNGEVNVSNISTANIGGVAGYLEATGLYNVEHNGDINISSVMTLRAGGIVGYANNTTGAVYQINSVVATGRLAVSNMTNSTIYLGGIVGYSSTYNLNMVTDNVTIDLSELATQRYLFVGAIAGRVSSASIQNFKANKDIIVSSQIFDDVRANKSYVALSGIVAINEGSIGLILDTGYSIARIYKNDNAKEYLFASSRVKADLTTGSLSTSSQKVMTVLEFYRNYISNNEYLGSQFDALEDKTSSTRLSVFIDKAKAELGLDVDDLVVNYISSDTYTINTDGYYVVNANTAITLNVQTFTGIIVGDTGDNKLTITLSSNDGFVNNGVLEGMKLVNATTITTNNGVLYNVAVADLEVADLENIVKPLVETNNYQMIKCAMMNNVGTNLVTTNNGYIYDSFAIVNSYMTNSGTYYGFVTTNNGTIMRCYFSGDVADVATNNGKITKCVSDKTLDNLKRKFTSKSYTDFISDKILDTLGSAFVVNTSVEYNYGYPLIVDGLKLSSLLQSEYYPVYKETQWNMMAKIHENNPIKFQIQLYQDLDFSNKTFVPISSIEGGSIVSAKTDDSRAKINNTTNYLVGNLDGTILDIDVGVKSFAVNTLDDYTYSSGLVGKMTDGTIQNVTVTINLTGSTTLKTNYFGGLIGYAYRSFSIFNNIEINNVNVVYNNVKINIPTSTYAGGLIGYAYNVDISVENQNIVEKLNIAASTTDTYDASHSSVIRESAVGGLIGNATNTSIDGEIYVDADISGVNYVGGIAGYASNISFNGKASHIGTISKYTNSTNNKYFGGAIGYLADNSFSGDLSHVGNITGYDYVGGLIGYIARGTISLDVNIGEENSTTNISGNDYVGGIVGYLSNSNLKPLNNAQPFAVGGDIIFPPPVLVNTNLIINSANIFIKEIKGASYVGGYAGYANGNVSLYVSSIFENDNKSSINASGDYVGCVFGQMLSSLNYNNFVLSIFVNITKAGNYVGGYAGETSVYSSNMSMAINGDINASGDYVGGFAGIINKTLTLQSIFTSVDIEAKNYVGGIVGAINNNVTFINIESTGNITAQDYVGGIVGAAQNQKSMILSALAGKNLVNESSIKARSYVGGILGSGLINIGSMASGEVINSGELRASDSYLGGIIGEITGMTSSGTAYNDLSFTNNCKLDGEKYVGGFAGVISCDYLNLYGRYYIYGMLYGSQYVGGFIGGYSLKTTPTIKIVTSLDLNTSIHFDFEDYYEGHGDDDNVNKLFTNNVKTSQIAGPNGTLKTGGWYGEVTVRWEHNPTWYGMTSIGRTHIDEPTYDLYAKDSSDSNMQRFFGNMPDMSEYENDKSDAALEYFIRNNNVYQKQNTWDIPVGLLFGFSYNKTLVNYNTYSSCIYTIDGNSDIYLDSFAKTFYQYKNSWGWYGDNLYALVIEFIQRFDNYILYPTEKEITLSDISDVYVAKAQTGIPRDTGDNGKNSFDLSSIDRISGVTNIRNLLLVGSSAGYTLLYSFRDS